MRVTDTTETGLESLIMRHLTGQTRFAVPPGEPAQAPDLDGIGYFAGSPKDYDRAHSLDVPQLFAFLLATQPDTFNKLALASPADPKDISRLKFLTRLSSEIGRRGVIDVLRHGLDHGPLHFRLFYGTPSAGKRHSRSPQRAQPLLHHPPARLQHGRDPPRT